MQDSDDFLMTRAREQDKSIGKRSKFSSGKEEIKINFYVLSFSKRKIPILIRVYLLLYDRFQGLSFLKV